ncbi:MAG: hypothetical protein K2Y37_10200 [Pirellulales bacterium]|nr:hypothetical protein [Pirellulales bacterium]
MSHRPGIWQLALAAAVAWSANGLVAQETSSPDSVPTRPQATNAAPNGDTSAEAEPSPPPASAPAIAERLPSVFLVPDAAGGLQPVLNLSLDRLEHLLARDDGGGVAPQPEFALSLTASGDAHATDVALEVSVEIKALKGGWIAVPLRLDEGLLVPRSDRYTGAGSAVIVPATGQRGYLCWIRGDADTTHKLQLSLRVPLEFRSGESQLRLTLPRTTGALLALHVGGDRVQGRTVEPAILDVDPVVEGGGTNFRLQSPGVRFELHWSPVDAEGSDVVQSLVATANVAVHVEGQLVRSQAQISVQSLVGEFSRFHVRLPPGAQLSHVPAGRGITIQEVAAIDAETPLPADEEATGSIVVVRLSRPAEQVELQLETERNLGEQTASDDIELAGFAVVEARRQSGYYALAVDGDRQVVWQRQHQVRQITPAELPAPLPDEKWLAAFEFTAQPSALACRLVSRAPRVTASASCNYLVEADAIRLEARLKYSVRGARVFELACQGLDASWNIEEVGPVALVDLDGLHYDQREPLVIPLLKPALGEIEITIVARRPWSEDNNPWRQAVVEPVANVVRAGSLIVASASNVQVVPKTSELVGLVPQPLTATEGLFQLAAEDVLSYRTTEPRPLFVAQCRRLARETSAQVTTVIECRRTDVLITQTNIVQVAHEAASYLEIAAPASWGAIDEREVLIDGHPATFLETDETPLDANDGDRAPLAAATQERKTWRMTLPQPRLGRVEILVRYPLPLVARPAGKATELAVPLAMPRVDRLTHNELRLQSQSGIEPRVVSRQWRVGISEPLSRLDHGGGRRFRAEGPVYDALLQVSAGTNDTTEELLVDRVWIQTWQLGSDRLDRAVFVVATSEPRIEFVLPPGADRQTWRALVGGKPVIPTQGATNRTVVPLSGDAARPQVVELRYRCAGALSRWGRMELIPPTMAPVTWVRQVYWQFVCSDQDHLVLIPANWGPEFSWHWSGLGWHRLSRLDDGALERWSGAKHETEAPQGYHRYLISRLGDLQPARIVTAPRWLLVLISSGITLVAGLALLYVPSLRRPELLVTVGLMIAVITLLDLHFAVLVSQAGSLGVLLSLLAAWWRRQLRSRQPMRVVVTRSNSSRLERDLTPTAFAVAGTGSNSSTTAASVPVE